MKPKRYNIHKYFLTSKKLCKQNSLKVTFLDTWNVTKRLGEISLNRILTFFDFNIVNFYRPSKNFLINDKWKNKKKSSMLIKSTAQFSRWTDLAYTRLMAYNSKKKSFHDRPTCETRRACFRSRACNRSSADPMGPSPNYSRSTWSSSRRPHKRTSSSIRASRSWSRWQPRVSTPRASVTGRPAAARHTRWLGRRGWWVIFMYKCLVQINLCVTFRWSRDRWINHMIYFLFIFFKSCKWNGQV